MQGEVLRRLGRAILYGLRPPRVWSVIDDDGDVYRCPTSRVVAGDVVLATGLSKRQAWRLERAIQRERQGAAPRLARAA